MRRWVPSDLRGAEKADIKVEISCSGASGGTSENFKKRVKIHFTHTSWI